MNPSLDNSCNTKTRFSAPIQTGPWARPTSYTMGTGFIS